MTPFRLQRQLSIMLFVQIENKISFTMIRVFSIDVSLSVLRSRSLAATLRAEPEPIFLLVGAESRSCIF